MSVLATVNSCVDSAFHICSWGRMNKDLNKNRELLFKNVEELLGILIVYRSKKNDELGLKHIPISRANDLLLRVRNWCDDKDFDLSTVVDELNIEITHCLESLNLHISVIIDSKVDSLAENMGIMKDKVDNGKQEIVATQETIMISLDKIAELLQEQTAKNNVESLYEHDPPLAYHEDDNSVLGRGTFGITYRMKNTIDFGLYAVKVIRVKDAKAFQIEISDMQREASFLQRLNHPHIVRYFTSFLTDKNSKFRMVMELVTGGTLANKVKDNSVGFNIIARWLLQLTSALCYMHFDMKVQHRDIKPENILLTTKNDIKIIDLGLACIVKSRASKVSRVGTSCYFSYEKANELPYDGRDDVWASGCAIAELLTKTRLFDIGGPINLPSIPQVNERRLKLISNCMAINKPLGNIVDRMLVPEQDLRINAKELQDLLSNASFISMIELSKLDDIAKRLQSQSQFSNHPETLYSHDPPDRKGTILSQGYCSVTYRKVNSLDKSLYAVKVFKWNEYEIDFNVLKEVSTLLNLSHAHIVRYFIDFWSIDGKSYHVVMELCSENLLEYKMKDVNALDIIGNWLKQMVSALCYLHYDRKIHHGHITPVCILLTPGKNIKLLMSLGRSISKYTIGKGVYKSYEKALGLPTDGRDDVWSTGCVFSELISKIRIYERGGIVNMTPEANLLRLKLIYDCSLVDSKYGVIIGRMLEPLQENRCTSIELANLLDDISSINIEVESSVYSKKSMYNLLPLAAQGDVEAQYYLGHKYLKSTELLKIHEESFRYFKMAADSGHADAQLHVSDCYLKGQGVIEDKEMSFKYLKMSADQGNVVSLFKLYKSYELGVGVEVNKVEATRYLKRAASKGSEDAKKILSERSMTYKLGNLFS